MNPGIPTHPHVEALSFRVTAAPVFRRLFDVTFLGILSPRYRGFPGHPLADRAPESLGDDGSRGDHTLGVAAGVLQICEGLNLSPEAWRYGAAWAFSHDIATWPLSHTGEPAFSDVLGWDARSLRAAMIVGDPRVPEPLHLRAELEAGGVEPETLLRLFAKRPERLGGDLVSLHHLLHSPITPDSLEGIHRSAQAIGLPSPDPALVAASVTLDLYGSVVQGGRSSPIVQFWRAKKTVYESYINRPAVVRFESRWSRTLQACVQGLTLEQSFTVDEASLVRAVEARGLEPYQGVQRYKAPLKYRFGQATRRDQTYPVRELSAMLTRKAAGEG